MARKKTKPAKAPKPAEVEELPKPKLRRVRADEPGEPELPKARSDVFTGLAALSLLALLGAAYFFYQNHEDTVAKSLAAPQITIPSAASVTDAPKGRN